MRRAGRSRAALARRSNGESDEDEDVSASTEDEASDSDDDVDDDSEDEYKGGYVNQKLKKEYQQVQRQAQQQVLLRSSKTDQAPATPAPYVGGRSAARAKPVDYKEKKIGDIPFRVVEKSAPKKATKKAAQNQPDFHSSDNPFLSSQDDIDRLLTEKTLRGFTNEEAEWYTQVPKIDPVIGKSAPNLKTGGRKATMKTTINYAAPTNGHVSTKGEIINEWLSADDALFEGNFQTFKNLDDNEKRMVIQREAEEYGMEKPHGYGVSFHYNPHVEYHHFGSSHPMKPWRLTLTKQLVLAYGLEYCMELYEPRPATSEELAIFHDRGYLDFLSKVTPQNAKPDDRAYLAFGFGGDSNDCPVFDGLWNYVSIYSGASMSAASNLLNKQSDVAINWSGGLHHAKKNHASGFCYINDIVLAIQLLLTQNQRVLYIDIDVHHGDGVEAAFESTDRVFTLSYHKYGLDKNGYPFFPGTGSIDDMGPRDPANRGKGHSLNIPIDDGIDDEQYKYLFRTVTGAVVEKYNPTAIVLQSGADSLGGDRLGRFNLNIKAHGSCVETVKNYGRPLLLIGGGGYTPRNVARTWCHETAVCVGTELHNDLPTHLPYIQAFQGPENGGGILYPDLHNVKRHDNLNTGAKVQKLVEQAMENLRYLEGAPSVVVNTTGLSDEMIMRAREEVDREMEEQEQARESLRAENNRRRRERNTGGRGERAMR